MAFKDRLKAARKFRGMTQKDVAEKLGIAPQAYSQYERGLKMPRQDNLEKIAEILDLSICYTQNGDVYFEPPPNVSVAPFGDFHFSLDDIQQKRDDEFLQAQLVDVADENISPLRSLYLYRDASLSQMMTTKELGLSIDYKLALIEARKKLENK